MKAKKFIENERVGEYELIKNHVIDISIESKDLDATIDYLNLCDDSEEAYLGYGVAFDFGDALFFVEIDKFLKGVDNYFEEERDMPDWMNDFLAVLREYNEYTLYP